MSIPGINLLRLASSVIKFQTVQHFKFLSRTADARGTFVPSYADPVNIKGSLQPVPLRMFTALGLDFNKEYVILYTSTDVVTVGRDGSGDRLSYNGKNYVCEDRTDWNAQDGWNGVIAVYVPPLP